MSFVRNHFAFVLVAGFFLSGVVFAGGIQLPALVDCRKGTEIVLVGEVAGRPGLYGQVLQAKARTKGDEAVKQAKAVTELIPVLDEPNAPVSLHFNAENENQGFSLEAFLEEAQADLTFSKNGESVNSHFYHCTFHSPALDIKPTPNSKAIHTLQDLIYGQENEPVKAAIQKLADEKFVNPGAMTAVRLSAAHEKTGTVATYLVSAEYSRSGDKPESKSLMALVKVWDQEESGELVKIVTKIE